MNGIDLLRLPQRQTLERCLHGAARTGAAMREAAKGFRRLKSCKHLPSPCGPPLLLTRSSTQMSRQQY